MPTTIIQPPGASKPSGFSHGIVAQGGRTLYLAGQIADREDKSIVGLGDMMAQFDRALENFVGVVRAAGGEPTDVVKMTLYVLNKHAYLADPKRTGEIYRKHFGKHFPTMTLAEVTGLATPGTLIEIDGIAVIG